MRLPVGAKFLEMNNLKKDNRAFNLHVDEFYAPDMERGLRWNDPKFDIGWPIKPTVISDKDQGYPDFNPAYHLVG